MEKLQPLLLKPEQVQEMTGWGRTKVYELIKNSSLPVVRQGRGVRIPFDALQNWIRSNTTLAVEKAK